MIEFSHSKITGSKKVYLNDKTIHEGSRFPKEFKFPFHIKGSHITFVSGRGNNMEMLVNNTAFDNLQNKNDLIEEKVRSSTPVMKRKGFSKSAHKNMYDI